MNIILIQALIFLVNPLRPRWYRKVILAQAKLETGIFNSLAFHRRNNLFGMKTPKRRNHLGTNSHEGEYNNDLMYPTWLHSIIDRCWLWEHKNTLAQAIKLDDPVFYMAQITKAGYSTSGSYFHSWKGMYNKT